MAYTFFFNPEALNSIKSAEGWSATTVYDIIGVESAGTIELGGDSNAAEESTHRSQSIREG